MVLLPLIYLFFFLPFFLEEYRRGKEKHPIDCNKYYDAMHDRQKKKCKRQPIFVSRARKSLPVRKILAIHNNMAHKNEYRLMFWLKKRVYFLNGQILWHKTHCLATTVIGEADSRVCRK